LDLRTTHRDTLPWPLVPDSLLRPERTSAGGAPRALAGGLLAAAAVIVLPSLISGDSHASGGRFAVAVATGAAGIVGFSARRHAQPIPANIAANQGVRLAWQRRVDDVREENANRTRAPRTVIRAGPARTVTP